MLWTENDIHIERIFPSQEFWLDKVALVQQFFTMAILPELLGKFYSRTEEPKVTSSPAQDPCASGALVEDTTDGKDNSSTSSEIKLYCYCKVRDGEDMVGCDNKACEREWFHLKCLKLQNFPSTKYWYCPDCRKLPQFKNKGKRRKN